MKLPCRQSWEWKKSHWIHRVSKLFAGSVSWTHLVTKSNRRRPQCNMTLVRGLLVQLHHWHTVRSFYVTCFSTAASQGPRSPEPSSANSLLTWTPASQVDAVWWDQRSVCMWVRGEGGGVGDRGSTRPGSRALPVWTRNQRKTKLQFSLYLFNKLASI